jgi:hypothetical protein
MVAEATAVSVSNELCAQTISMVCQKPVLDGNTGDVTRTNLAHASTTPKSCKQN